MPPLRPKDLPTDTNLDGSEKIILDGADGVRSITLDALQERCKGDPGEDGDDGADGADFHIDAFGALEDRATYDSAPAGFVYLDDENGDIYIRAETVGVWSNPVPFKGDPGLDGDPGPPGDSVTLRFSDDVLDDSVGIDGDLNWVRGDSSIYERQSGAYVLVARLGFPSTLPDTEEPTTPSDLESDDGTYITTTTAFIYDAAGNEWRLGEAVGSDYRILLNGLQSAATIVGVALLYYAPPPTTQRNVYYKNSSDEWFIYTGLGTGPNGYGWTSIVGDPRGGDEEARDPTDPVSIMPSGNKVYRFGAAHADPESAWVIDSFDNTNSGGHDYLKIGEVLDALSKTIDDVVIAYPGTPAARITISGTSFQIDITALTDTLPITLPERYFNDVMYTTTDDAATLPKSIELPDETEDTVLIADVELYDTSGNVADITSLYLGATPMVRHTPANFANVYVRQATFYLLNPTPGTYTALLTPNYSGSKHTRSMSVSFRAYRYVDQGGTPLGPNVGTQYSVSNTISNTLTTTEDSSLLLTRALIGSVNTNPVNPVGSAVEILDTDIGTAAVGGHGLWIAEKPALTAGTGQNVSGTLSSGTDGITATTVELFGSSSEAAFDIGPYATTNVGGGGPDIATDITPADWPVAEGTGIGGGGTPSEPPTPGTFWEGVLVSHGINSDLSRSWTDTELAGFALHATMIRMFGYARPAPYSSFADDTQNIDLIERIMAAGMKVLYCPFTATKYDGVHPVATFPNATDTAAVTAYKNRLADIAAVALARGWSTDMFALEMWNEPLSSLGHANAFAFYQQCVTAVRAVNEDIWLSAMGNGREGNSYEPYYAGWLRSGPLTDPRSGEHRIAYAHHHYLPMEFTHQGTSSQFPSGVSWPTGSYGIAQIRAQLTDFRNWANDESVQIFIGETGASKFAPSLAQRQQYVSDVFTVARELAIPTCLWADDNHSDATIGGGWFGVMQGTTNNAVLVPSWASLVASAGAA